jgi:hypothetical protein
MLSRVEWQVLHDLINDALILERAKIGLHRVIDRELVHEEEQAKEAAWAAFKRGSQAAGYASLGNFGEARVVFETWWKEQSSSLTTPIEHGGRDD